MSPPRDVVLLLGALSCPWCLSSDGAINGDCVDHYHDELADGSPCPMLTNDDDEDIYLDQLEERLKELGGTLPDYYAPAAPMIRPACRGT